MDVPHELLIAIMSKLIVLIEGPCPGGNRSGADLTLDDFSECPLNGMMSVLDWEPRRQRGVEGSLETLMIYEVKLAEFMMTPPHTTRPYTRRSNDRLLGGIFLTFNC